MTNINNISTDDVVLREAVIATTEATDATRGGDEDVAATTPHAHLGGRFPKFVRVRCYSAVLYPGDQMCVPTTPRIYIFFIIRSRHHIARASAVVW